MGQIESLPPSPPLEETREALATPAAALSSTSHPLYNAIQRPNDLDSTETALRDVEPGPRAASRIVALCAATETTRVKLRCYEALIALVSNHAAPAGLSEEGTSDVLDLASCSCVGLLDADREVRASAAGLTLACATRLSSAGFSSRFMEMKGTFMLIQNLTFSPRSESESAVNETILAALLALEAGDAREIVERLLLGGSKVSSETKRLGLLYLFPSVGAEEEEGEEEMAQRLWPVALALWRADEEIPTRLVLRGLARRPEDLLSNEPHLASRLGGMAASSEESFWFILSGFLERCTRERRRFRGLHPATHALAQRVGQRMGHRPRDAVTTLAEACALSLCLLSASWAELLWEYWDARAEPSAYVWSALGLRLGWTREELALRCRPASLLEESLLLRGLACEPRETDAGSEHLELAREIKADAAIAHGIESESERIVRFAVYARALSRVFASFGWSDAEEAPRAIPTEAELAEAWPSDVLWRPTPRAESCDFGASERLELWRSLTLPEGEDRRLGLIAHVSREHRVSPSVRFVNHVAPTRGSGNDPSVEYLGNPETTVLPGNVSGIVFPAQNDSLRVHVMVDPREASLTEYTFSAWMRRAEAEGGEETTGEFAVVLGDTDTAQACLVVRRRDAVLGVLAYSSSSLLRVLEFIPFTSDAGAAVQMSALASGWHHVVVIKERGRARLVLDREHRGDAALSTTASASSLHLSSRSFLIGNDSKASSPLTREWILAHVHLFRRAATLQLACASPVVSALNQRPWDSGSDASKATRWAKSSLASSAQVLEQLAVELEDQSSERFPLAVEVVWRFLTEPEARRRITASRLLEVCVRGAAESRRSQGKGEAACPYARILAALM